MYAHLNVKTITRWSPALLEIRSYLDLLQGAGLAKLSDFLSYYFPCWLWHAWQRLRGRTSQYHRTHIGAGWSVGEECRGEPAWPLNLHQQFLLSPPHLRWKKALWDWQQTSWHCGWWCVTSCRRSNSCLRRHCWSSWLSVSGPAWGCVLTTPSLPLPAPENRNRETTKKCIRPQKTE